MDALKQALAILKHPHLKGIFAARDIWGAIAVIQRHASVQTADPRVFVQRGRAGMSIIVWLAEAAARLRQYGQPLVRIDDPIILSAVDWLQSSLTISERQAGGSVPGYPRTSEHGFLPRAGAGGGSAWAELGA